MNISFDFKDEMSNLKKWLMHSPERHLLVSPTEHMSQIHSHLIHICCYRGIRWEFFNFINYVLSSILNMHGLNPEAYTILKIKF